MTLKLAKNSLKVLFLDIETSPNLGWCWGKYEQNIIKFEQESYMLCFTAKWLGSKEVITFGLDDFPAYKKDKKNDSELVKKLWELLDEADIVVAHNGDSFDIKKTNARFLMNGLGPPSPFRSIDTKKVAKKYFLLNSNKLDDIGKNLNVGKKLSTGGFKLWLGCMDGNETCWKKMKKYNKQDVVLLEDVYLKLRPWINPHPNVGINICKHSCNNCGGSRLQRRGFSYSRQVKYQRFQCTSCGAWKQGPVEKDE